MSYTHREVELLQLFSKSAEIDAIIELLKIEKRRIKDEIKRVQALVHKKGKGSQETLD